MKGRKGKNAPKINAKPKESSWLALNQRIPKQRTSKPQPRKELGFDQNAACCISFRLAPLKRAQEELTARVSWARTRSVRMASVPAILIHSTSQRAKVEVATSLWGAIVATKRDDDALMDLVRSTYHLRALTGHQTLSSSTEDKVEIAGRKISTGPDFKDWFLAMKPILGIRRTPEASQRKCPGSTQRALKELTLWPEAMATRNAVFNVSRRKEFERSRSQNLENGRQTPGGKKRLRRRSLQKEGLEQTSKELGIRYRRTVAKTSMT